MLQAVVTSSEPESILYVGARFVKLALLSIVQRNSVFMEGSEKLTQQEPVKLSCSNRVLLARDSLTGPRKDDNQTVGMV